MITKDTLQETPVRPGDHWLVTLSVLLLALILAVADLLTITLSILLLIAAGVLFGVFVNSLSHWTCRHSPMPYRVSYALVVFLMLVAIGLGFFMLGSQVADQASTLWSELQGAAKQLPDRVNQFEWAKRVLPDEASAEQIWQMNQQMMPRIMQGVNWLAWGVTGVFVIFFVGLYVAYDPSLYTTGLVKLVPRHRRERATEVLQTMNKALLRWIVARLISMTIVGVATSIGLWLLNVPLAITLGILAALFTFIPNIGPILAAIPQALLALQVGTTTALYVLLLNLALQTVESYIITPVVERYEVTLPPALTVFMQVLMGVLVGVIGVIMAAPLTAALMVLVQMIYIQDRLGDPSPGRLANEQS
jgi:predicted PurR-regulated permease PerM